MNITIKAQNTSVTPAINDYVMKRMGAVSKFIKQNEADAILHVMISKANKHHNSGDEMFVAEVNLNAGVIHLHAQTTDADLYAAIDAVKDDIIRELTNEKKKRITLIRRSGQRIKNMMRGITGWK